MDAPAPFNLASMGGPATPDFGNVQPSPATSGNMATITVVPPEQVAAQADVAHHALLGKLATNLMGMNTSYQVDPSTGSLVAQQSPNKPGMFFRSVLAASLLGGAAGADGNPNQGFMGGLVRGAGAGMVSANQQDALKRAQAQQQYADQLKAQENQRAQATQDREQMIANATVQNMHSEMVARDRRSDLDTQEAHDKHNAASAAVQKVLIDAGGTPAKIPTADGAKDTMTAPELAQAYMKDQSIRQGPAGFIRHFIDTTDSSELTYNGKNWVTADGTPVNMSDKTTVRVIDVPEDAMKKKVPTTGADINAAYGAKLIDPKATYQMSPLDMDGINTKRLAAARQQATIDTEKEKADSQKKLDTAEAASHYATAAHLNEQTKEMKDKASVASTGALAEQADPKNVGADGINHSFLTSLAATNPPRAALIQAIGVGREVPNAYMLGRKEGEGLMADVHAAFPDYDVSKASAYQAIQKSYSSGKDKDQIEALNTAYRHLAQAYGNASNPLAIVPGTPAHATYNSDTQQLKEEINSAYTHGVLTKEKAGSLEGDLLSVLPNTRKTAIKEIFALLGDKTEEKQRSWQRAKPSSVISDYPLLSPEAQAAHQAVTGKPISPTGEMKVSSAGSFTPPPSAIAGRDAQGNIVVYKLPDGSVVDAKTGQPSK